MNLNLKNKIIIVSGGAKGIGACIVQLLASEGAFPIIIGHNEKDNLKLLSAIEKTNGRGDQFVAELTRPEDCKRAIYQVMEKYYQIDGLVNNAGVNDGVGLEKGNHEDFVKSLNKNLVHYYLLCHYALPALKSSRGSIVNIASKTAETGQGGTSGYAAANGGRLALTREWAVELLQFGIRVNALVVAECWTPLYESWINSFDIPQKKLLEINKRIPLGGRMTTTSEIANMAVFLLSELSSHTTGQLIHVDGGYVHLDRAISHC
jgi:L-fucose dehydrogenase